MYIRSIILYAQNFISQTTYGTHQIPFGKTRTNLALLVSPYPQIFPSSFIVSISAWIFGPHRCPRHGPDPDPTAAFTSFTVCAPSRMAFLIVAREMLLHRQTLVILSMTASLISLIDILRKCVAWCCGNMKFNLLIIV